MMHLFGISRIILRIADFFLDNNRHVNLMSCARRIFKENNNDS